MTTSRGHRTALVTGGSRGIGRGIALTLAQKGYDVALTYATARDSALEVARLIQDEYDRECYVMQASLEDPRIPAQVVQWAIESLGHLDVLVNNAGVTILGSITEMEPEKMDYLINLNFKAYLLAAQEAAKHMIAHGIPGNIIFISSTRGERAYPRDWLYGGLKAAINRATQAIALDLAPHGIRVNSVAPGATQIREPQPGAPYVDYLAKRIPLGRKGTPQDIGNAVAWLCSEKASYITGITLKVDGGLILPGMPEHPGQHVDQGWGFVHTEEE
ncbi:MAG: SDR family oxidoreductase [Firmicutes bacterium]|nr:SDR family oxidoreductase [Bacillota bacterium]